MYIYYAVIHEVHQEKLTSDQFGYAVGVGEQHHFPCCHLSSPVMHKER